MKLFKWELGRQNNSGYKKMTLFYFRKIKMDCYILSFPKDSYIQPHIDKVDKLKHYQLNVILKKPKKGGKFRSEKTILNINRIIFFRPDLNIHSVSKIEEGLRIVLSIGLALN